MGQNWTESGELPNQVSSQSLILSPLPTTHLYPIFKAWKVDLTPFQNLERLGLVLATKLFGLLAEDYFLSMTCFHNLPSPAMYLLTQDPRRQRLISCKLGMPSPPNSFFIQTNLQLAKCIFLCPSKSFQRQLAIWELIISTAHLGNLKKDRR